MFNKCNICKIVRGDLFNMQYPILIVNYARFSVLNYEKFMILALAPVELYSISINVGDE